MSTTPTNPRIRTTVVGSYPVPDWLAALPSQQALIDATRVVFKTQEMAGIDVVADGELYRFDVNHPDTNGMIEYFTRPMSGIRSAITRTDVAEFSRQEGMAFRAEPAGVVEAPIGEGTLNLPRDYRRARALTRHPMKFTLTGPHMLSKTLMDRHYKSREALAMSIGRALAAQVAEIDADVLQVDEANITGHADESDWAQTELATLRTKSPLSCKVSLRLLAEGAERTDFADEMRAEYALAGRIVRTHDFREGVHALLIHKHNNPQWDPPTPEEVDGELLDVLFAPLPEHEALTPFPETGE